MTPNPLIAPLPSASIFRWQVWPTHFVFQLYFLISFIPLSFHSSMGDGPSLVSNGWWVAAPFLLTMWRHDKAWHFKHYFSNFHVTFIWIFFEKITWPRHFYFVFLTKDTVTFVNEVVCVGGHDWGGGDHFWSKRKKSPLKSHIHTVWVVPTFLLQCPDIGDPTG